MKITAIETIPVALPYESGAAPLPLGGRPRTKMESLLIKVSTDTGLVGWGDAFGVNIWPVTRALFERLIGPLCIGADPLQRTELMDTLSRTLYHFGLAGPLQYALSGLDIALWDLAGKAANLPVHALIGPRRTADMPVYASLLPYRDPALAARYAARAVDEGYRYVKLHERDVASVVQTRAAIGDDVGLMVDLNCAFDLPGAEQFARDVSHTRPMWLEEPVFPPDDFEAIHELSKRTDLPLALGENVGTAGEFERVLKNTGIRYAQPSALKTGGITALLRVARAAEKHQVSLMPHSAYFGPGLLATLHVLATLEGAPIIERFYCEIPVELCGEAARVNKGFMRVPDAPGLGFDPDPEVLKKYAAV
jgi:L-alanine-DL-glutamate epimerase-like enolase superfamily enzyme